MASIAARVRVLDAEIAELDDDLDALLTPLAPTLLALQGVGLEVAGQLLVTAGDNPERIADYVERRTQQGRTKKEIIRCLKRYIAPEVFAAIKADLTATISP